MTNQTSDKTPKGYDALLYTYEEFSKEILDRHLKAFWAEFDAKVAQMEEEEPNHA